MSTDIATGWCPTCNGSGYDYQIALGDAMNRRCPNCAGIGRADGKPVVDCDFVAHPTAPIELQCRGSGWLWIPHHRRCPECDGRGKVLA